MFNAENNLLRKMILLKYNKKLLYAVMCILQSRKSQFYKFQPVVQPNLVISSRLRNCVPARSLGCRVAFSRVANSLRTRRSRRPLSARLPRQPVLSGSSRLARPAQPWYSLSPYKVQLLNIQQKSQFSFSQICFH